MGLFVKSAGWDAEDDGEAVFRIVLQADTKDDVPKLTVDAIWGRKEVALILATDLPE